MKAKELADKVRAQASNSDFSAYWNNGLECAAKFIERELEDYAIVPIVDCPDCENTGQYPPVGLFKRTCGCRDNPASRYNNPRGDV